MRPYQNYQRIDVSTAEPLRIIILLYEGAIKNLNQAARLFPTEPTAASKKLNRTLDIINYLRNSLDFEKGEEVAFNLGRLYDYMRDVLAQANINKDTAKIEEVIGLLQTLLEGWRGISGGTTTVADGADQAAPAKISMVG
jgi:flagellar protein FliS